MWALVVVRLVALPIFSVGHCQIDNARNFSHPLSHLDALYFTVGSFSTAGTGDLIPISENARAVQMLQELIDLVLVLIAGTGVVIRFVSASNGRPDARWAGTES